MYNLFVSAKTEDWEGSSLLIEESRCVNDTEFTESDIAAKYGTLDAVALSELQQLPCIFAYESGCRKPPKFGCIKEITRRQGYVRIEYEIIDVGPFLTHDNLDNLSFELDIRKWELNRTHWGVKNVDLVKELKAHGITVPVWAQDKSKNDSEFGVSIVPKKNPRVFISYSWDNEPHKQWVLDFATRLRSQGIDAKLDRWEIELGQHIPHFMETAVSTNDFVLIVLTKNYRKKSDERTGGVGYEGHIMTAETYSGADPRKFITVLREGSWEDSSPRWLKGKRGVDLTSSNSNADEQFCDLTDTLHGLQKKAPPLGPSPKGRTLVAIPAKVSPVQQQQHETGPIRILNIIISEIGTPRNDGTAGSALYSVPFQLSRVPSSEWAKHFMDTWDRPPSMTTMHRPGIARVSGDRLILDGTTVEEVANLHRETLKLVLEKVNRDVETVEEQKRQRETHDHEVRRRQKEAAEEAARKLNFD